MRAICGQYCPCWAVGVVLSTLVASFQVLFSGSMEVSGGSNISQLKIVRLGNVLVPFVKAICGQYCQYWAIGLLLCTLVASFRGLFWGSMDVRHVHAKMFSALFPYFSRTDIPKGSFVFCRFSSRSSAVPHKWCQCKTCLSGKGISKGYCAQRSSVTVLSA